MVIEMSQKETNYYNSLSPSAFHKKDCHCSVCQLDGKNQERKIKPQDKELEQLNRDKIAKQLAAIARGDL